jgi:hypothetical protein
MQLLAQARNARLKKKEEFEASVDDQSHDDLIKSSVEKSQKDEPSTIESENQEIPSKPGKPKVNWMKRTFFKLCCCFRVKVVPDATITVEKIIN